MLLHLKSVLGTARMRRRLLLLFLVSFKMGIYFFCFKTVLYLSGNTKRNRRNVQRPEIVAHCLVQLDIDRPRVLLLLLLLFYKA